MKLADLQLDMFGKPVPLENGHPIRKVLKPSAAASHPTGMDHEAMAKALEASGLYRISRKLVAPGVAESPRPGFPRNGLVIDTETTGLNHRTDEVIEIGAVAFSFNEAGQIGDVTGIYGGLRKPDRPVPAEITRLTGITDEMLEGQEIDFLALDRLVGPADLIIAHNAAFDRPFCERLADSFSQKAWACSVKEVDWKSRGFEGTKLGYLIGQAGYFHDGHRAVDDCFALLEVLSTPTGPQQTTGFSELFAASLRSRVRVWAENSPFDMKEKLKARGYRWSDGSDGKPKSWWTEVDEDVVAEELTFLRTEIYGRADVEPLTNYLTATVRYKA